MDKEEGHSGGGGAAMAGIIHFFFSCKGAGMVHGDKGATSSRSLLLE